jgi:hypothetical protein
MELIPVLLIIAIVLLLLRSRGRRFQGPSVTGRASRDPVYLILIIVVVLLLIRLVVRLVAPLGKYSLW